MNTGYAGVAASNMIAMSMRRRISWQMVSADAAPAEDEKRTTLSLSLTVSDKKALKMIAAERETTIAAIIHEWVAEHLEK